MANELTTAKGIFDLVESSKSKYTTTEVVKASTGTMKYLPYLQLVAANSKHVTEHNRTPGTFALTKGRDNVVELSKEIVVLVLGWRAKAMQFAPTINSYFDPNSDEYKKVVERADSSRNSKAAYGLELLIWLPNSEELTTFFLGSKTARNEAENIVAAVSSGKRQFKFKSKPIRGKEHTWYGFETSIYEPELKSWPNAEMLKDILERFNNPPAVEGDTDEEADSDKDDSRQ